MTEQEWLECTSPRPMLDFIRGKVSDRKLRLFSVACCYRIWEYIMFADSRAVVEITERSADDPVDGQDAMTLDYDLLTDDCGGPEESHRTAYMVAGHVGHSSIGRIAGLLHPMDDWKIAVSTAEGATETMRLGAWERAAEVVRASMAPKTAAILTEQELAHFSDLLHRTREGMSQEAKSAEEAVQCGLIRDIFGNPFRLVSLAQSWLSPGVVSLSPGVVSLAAEIYDERAFEQMPAVADLLEQAGCDQKEILDHCRGPGPHVRGCWIVDLLLGKA